MCWRPTATVFWTQSMNMGRESQNTRNTRKNEGKNKFEKEKSIMAKMFNRIHTHANTYILGFRSKKTQSSQQQNQTPKQKGIAESAIFIIVIDVTPFSLLNIDIYLYLFVNTRSLTRHTHTSLNFIAQSIYHVWHFMLFRSPCSYHVQYISKPFLHAFDFSHFKISGMFGKE